MLVDPLQNMYPVYAAGLNPPSLLCVPGVVHLAVQVDHGRLGKTGQSSVQDEMLSIPSVK